MKYLFAIVWLFSAAPNLAQPPAEKTLLWKITRTGSLPASYLYGTYHLACPEDLAVPDTVRHCFRQAKTLYLELNLDDPATALQLMQVMPMQKGILLPSLLNKASYDSAAAIFKQTTGMPLGMFNQIKPLFVTMMLYPSLMKCKPEGWETVFAKMARENKMVLKGLETAAFQASLFDSIPYADQAQELLQALYHLDSMAQASQEMTMLYRQKDLPALYNAVKKDTSFNRMEEAMLNKRNRNWMPLLVNALQSEPCFIAVGAAHLAGPHGLIALLRKKGYTVTPILY